MKTLIVYASKYGSVADCASFLSSKLSGEVSVVDVNKITQQIDVGSFDRVIIGGSIYAGSVSKKLSEFCKDNLDILLTKVVGIFICCAFGDKLDELLSINFSAALLDVAKSKKHFGGEAKIDEMSFMDKTITKAVMKKGYSHLKILNENIEEFLIEMA